MLSVVQYLEYHGLRPDDVRGFIRELGAGESLLLVGSVAEGLANIESDLDLLLLEGDEDDHSDSRGNLLRENIEWLLRNRNMIEFAAPNCIQQRRALNQFIARQGKHPAFGKAANRMIGTSGAL